MQTIRVLNNIAFDLGEQSVCSVTQLVCPSLYYHADKNKDSYSRDVLESHNHELGIKKVKMVKMVQNFISV